MRSPRAVGFQLSPQQLPSTVGFSIDVLFVEHLLAIITHGLGTCSGTCCFKFGYIMRGNVAFALTRSPLLSGLDLPAVYR